MNDPIVSSSGLSVAKRDGTVLWQPKVEWKWHSIPGAPAPAAGASALAGWKGQAPSGPTPADSGGFAGLAAVDGKAGAAACALSMGQTFGARAVVHGELVQRQVAPEIEKDQPISEVLSKESQYECLGPQPGAVHPVRPLRLENRVLATQADEVTV